jgi:hypothetical protein
MNKVFSLATFCMLLIAVFVSGCISDIDGEGTDDGGNDNGNLDNGTGVIPSDNGTGDGIDDGADGGGSDDDGADDPNDGADDGADGGGSDDDGGDVPDDDGDNGTDDGEGGSDEPVPPIEGGEDDDDGSDNGTGNAIGDTVNVSLPQRSGWIESTESEESSELRHDEPVYLPEATVKEITFMIHVEDSDEEHAETDEGSEPDIIKSSATDSGDLYQESTATTPGDMIFTFKAEDGYLGQNWTVSIWGEEFGGGAPAYVFGFIVWVDQGAAWTLDVNYVYEIVE